MVELRRQIEFDSQFVLDLQRQTSRANFEEIQARFTTRERVLTTLQFVRDLSATTLIVASGLVSGGAALAALLGGSGIKGYGRWTDTESFGAAIAETAGSIVVGLIPIARGPGALASGGSVVGGTLVSAELRAATNLTAEAVAQQRVLLVVGAALDGTFTGVTALASGSRPREALVSAGLQTGASLFSGACGIELDSIAMPISRRILMEVRNSSIVSAGSTAVSLAFPESSRNPLMLNRQVQDGQACDANATLGYRNCDPTTWVREFVLKAA